MCALLPKWVIETQNPTMLGGSSSSMSHEYGRFEVVYGSGALPAVGTYFHDNKLAVHK
jgi:hypothetical protein